MNFPIKISDWSMDDYKLILQILGLFVIVIILTYIGLASARED